MYILKKKTNGKTNSLTYRPVLVHGAALVEHLHYAAGAVFVVRDFVFGIFFDEEGCVVEAIPTQIRFVCGAGIDAQLSHGRGLRSFDTAEAKPHRVRILPCSQVSEQPAGVIIVRRRLYFKRNGCFLPNCDV